MDQCLFFGDESLRYLAVMMSVARKTRWRVHGIPGIWYETKGLEKRHSHLWLLEIVSSVVGRGRQE